MVDPEMTLEIPEESVERLLEDGEITLESVDKKSNVTPDSYKLVIK